MKENLDPQFPKIKLEVFNGDTCIIIKSPCLPHELSATMAIFQPSWKLVITAVE